MSLASHPATARFYRHSGDAGHRHLIATPILNHRATSSRGIESSATAGTGTPQVAGHRINHPEASRDFAAARAQTVGAAPQTPSTIRRTRWRLRRLHTSQADYPCRKRQSRLRTPAMSRSRLWILNSAGRYRDSAPSLGSDASSTTAMRRCRDAQIAWAIKYA